MPSNKLTLILITFLFIFFSGCKKYVKVNFASNNEEQITKTFTANKDFGVIYVYRESEWHARDIRTILSIDNQAIAYLNGNNFIRLEVEEGNHDLRTLWQDGISGSTENSIIGHQRVDAKKGQIDYFKVKHCATWFRAGFCIHPADKKSAQSEIISYRLVMKEKFEYVAPKLIKQ